MQSNSIGTLLQEILMIKLVSEYNDIVSESAVFKHSGNYILISYNWIRLFTGILDSVSQDINALCDDIRVVPGSAFLFVGIACESALDGNHLSDLHSRGDLLGNSLPQGNLEGILVSGSILVAEVAVNIEHHVCYGVSSAGGADFGLGSDSADQYTIVHS